MKNSYLSEDEMLSKFEKPIRNVLIEQKKKGYSNSFKQFLINYSRGYGLFLSKDLIEKFSSENGNPIPFMDQLFEELQLNEFINRFVEKMQKEYEEKLKSIDQKKMAKSFFEGKSFDLLRTLLGFGYISKDTFLKEQSIIALVISIEAYVKDSFVELIKNDKSLLKKFTKEEKKINQETRFKIYNDETTIEEEIVDNLKLIYPNKISKNIQKRLGYSGFFLDEKHKRSIIHTYALRNSFIHSNGIVDKKLKIQIKCRNKIGNKYKIKDEKIIDYYSDCFDIIKKFEEWKIRKLN